MRLYLVQHGAALAKDVDPARPLSGQGEQGVRRIAGFLARGGISVGRIWHSGKLRAEQTATRTTRPIRWPMMWPAGITTPCSVAICRSWRA